MKKTIGILGGMGPEATAYFFELIIKNTKASKDQEHIPIVIYSNPNIPPRTDAIFNLGQSPLPYLIEGVKILRQAGVDLIVMPCVTAHYYYPQIIKQDRFPFLNLLEESLLFTKRNFPSLTKIGLIASTGTISSQLFHKTFEKESIQIFTPQENEQEKVMEAIFGKQGIKAGFISGHSKKIIISTALKLLERGAEAILAGCTEIPLVLTQEALPSPLIEPLQITAFACIKEAGYEIRSEKRFLLLS